MRIPLDYYRILGLPIQATAEQLKQSHRDRVLQVPRREYSELAIDLRRQLIDAAYDVLGNSARRAEYDQEFLAKSKAAGAASETDAPDANVPTIDIEPKQLVGALLILLELGEYELVLRLGRPYLKRDVQSPEGQQLKEEPALPDIILTLAVACLELGREEWQQNHYEHAAESLETGRELLLREDLFPVLRAEIQADLYKLRPYRCLELIARPLEHQQHRQEGINLLRGMLQDRSGIDGADDDLSGLGVDDFLRFVQQLRGYLTAAEQQEIFEAEAQRPSAVGTYLAVYALLARGFAQHQPALIRRAKQMLLRLSGRQDVHLEQAVCAVLLGQTEEASRALERSQEHEPLQFIREHSQGAPDLLPGLCLYAENWLQQEVFPFFRDLDQEPATLKDYFADSTVQAYLENLPLENERSARQSEWAAVGTTGQSFSAGSLGSQQASGQASSQFGSQTLGASASAGSSPFAAASNGLDSVDATAGTVAYGDRFSANTDTSSDTQSRFGGLGTRIGAAAGAAGAAVGAAGIADRISQMSPAGRLSTAGPATNGEAPRDTEMAGASRRDRRRRNEPKWDRLAIVVLGGVLGIVAGLWLLSKIVGAFTGSDNRAVIVGEPMDLEIGEPPIALSESSDATASVAADDAEGIAAATIDRWLEIKRGAYSSSYDIDELSNILTGSALSVTEARLEETQANNLYTDYTHGPVEILSVSPEDATDAENLSVQATVEEAGIFFEDGEQVSEGSTDEVVTASYELVKEGNQWLIESFGD